MKAISMIRFITVILALLCSVTAALSQGTILQGGPSTGSSPMYTGQGSGQAVVQDSGPAGGGGTGYGLSEQLLVARGTGTPPYVGQGTDRSARIGAITMHRLRIRLDIISFVFRRTRLAAGCLLTEPGALRRNFHLNSISMVRFIESRFRPPA